MKKYSEVLKQCPLFEHIGEEELETMLECLNARVVKAEKNCPIFQEGNPAGYVGIVLSGMVQIVKMDYYGNRSIMASAEPAQIFGEAFACAGAKTLPVSAIAASDSVVMLVDCRRILTVCKNACTFHTRLVNNLLQVVAVKNLQLSQKIEIISKRTTREKLMAYLLMEAKRHGSNEFRIPYDRQALADYLGVERSAMSAELGRMRKEGIIECRKNYFKMTGK